MNWSALDTHKIWQDSFVQEYPHVKVSEIKKMEKQEASNSAQVLGLRQEVKCTNIVNLLQLSAN